MRRKPKQRGCQSVHSRQMFARFGLRIEDLRRARVRALRKEEGQEAQSIEVRQVGRTP